MNEDNEDMVTVYVGIKLRVDLDAVFKFYYEGGDG